MVATLTPFDESLSGWERALYAFLAEKERRSGSRRTAEGYSRMLQHFFGAVGKPPERVTSPEVFAFAHGVGLSGRRLTSGTRRPSGAGAGCNVSSDFCVITKCQLKYGREVAQVTALMTWFSSWRERRRARWGVMRWVRAAYTNRMRSPYEPHPRYWTSDPRPSEWRYRQRWG